jgi:hypothetical protein
MTGHGNEWSRTNRRRPLRPAKRRLPTVTYLRLPRFDENFNTRWDDIECSLLPAPLASMARIMSAECGCASLPPINDDSTSQPNCEDDTACCSEKDTIHPDIFICDESVQAVVDEESTDRICSPMTPDAVCDHFMVSSTSERFLDRIEIVSSPSKDIVMADAPSEEDAALLLELSKSGTPDGIECTLSLKSSEAFVEPTHDDPENEREYEADDEVSMRHQPVRSSICVIA